MNFHIQNFQAIKNCEIELDPGIVYVLIGKNGSGKTSILKAIEQQEEKVLGFPEHISRYKHDLNRWFKEYLTSDEKLWIEKEILKVFSKHLEITKDGYIQSYDDGMTWYAFYLIALLHSKNNIILTFESPEISLHPSMIRSLIEIFKNYAEEHNMIILLSTHSPVVLNQFNENPHNVLVVSPEKTILLTDLCKPEWLSQFSIGSLYGRGELDL